jgi:hypothetical protein
VTSDTRDTSVSAVTQVTPPVGIEG